RHWAPDTTLASWQDVPVPGLSASMKPSAAWWALRQTQASTVRAAEDAVFGLRLVVHGPAAARPLAGVMKPLFDGVIAAFHGWSGAPDEALAIRLAAQLKVTPDAVEDALFDARESAL